MPDFTPKVKREGAGPIGGAEGGGKQGATSVAPREKLLV